jgi:hypothetical protein
LDSKGDREAAQAARWSAFERDLSQDHLHAYLRRLPDFDDVIATDRAIDIASRFRPFTTALVFLISWPALNEAANLIATRAGELDGMAIDTLEPTARALEARHPLAATLLLRAMVGDVARLSQAELYPRARAWVMEAGSLAAQISDFQGHEDHVTFEGRVRTALR